MKQVKRIEIIIDESHTDHVLRLLDAAAVTGYSVIRDVAGKGDRGVRGGDGLTDVFDNSYILIACEQIEVDMLLPQLREILHDYGGICLISDAQWVIH